MKKNIEEILQNADPAVLDGMFDTIKAEKIDEKNIKNKVLGKKSKKNTAVWRVLPIAVSFALIVAAGALVIPRLAGQGTEDPVTTVSTGDKSNAAAVIKPEKEYDSSLNALISLKDFDRIIWSDDTAPAYLPSNSEITVYNGIRVTKELYERLQTAKDDDIFAVTAKRNIDIPEKFEDFVYEGKTGKEYLDEHNRTYPIYGALHLLEQSADGNTTAFENWIRDSIIEEQGEEFLSKYYHDGVFNKELIEEDLVAARDASEYAARAYEAAFNAYAAASYPRIYAFREYNGIEIYNGYHAETDTPYYIMIVTKAQMTTLKADYDKADKHEVDYGFDFENGYFSLVPYSEEDVRYAQYAQNGSDTELPAIACEVEQIPETMAE